jgi:hypothetical protein
MLSIDVATCKSFIQTQSNCLRPSAACKCAHTSVNTSTKVPSQYKTTPSNTRAEWRVVTRLGALKYYLVCHQKHTASCSRLRPHSSRNIRAHFEFVSVRALIGVCAHCRCQSSTELKTFAMTPAHRVSNRVRTPAVVYQVHKMTKVKVATGLGLGAHKWHTAPFTWPTSKC